MREISKIDIKDFIQTIDGYEYIRISVKKIEKWIDRKPSKLRIVKIRDKKVVIIE